MSDKHKRYWVALAVLLVGAAVCAAADPNLLAVYWLDTGEGTQVWDESGNNRNGSFTGAVQWLAEGVIGGALQFTGGTVDVRGNVDGLQFGDRALSVTAWIKTAARDQAFFSKITQAGVGYNYAFGVGAYGGNGFAQMSNKNRANITSATAVDDGEWHHVGFTQAPLDTGEETWSMYVDGALETQFATDTLPDNGQGGMYLGQAEVSGGFNNNYTGALDELYVYGSVLDEADMPYVMDGATWKPRARNPQPVDGAILSGPSVTLSWEAGWADTALGEHLAPDRHRVYLSTDVNAVQTGGEEVLAGEVTDTSLTVADLQLDATYYWRVDEVNNVDPNGLWTGPVWSFSVPSLAAKDPTPADEAKFQSVHVTLRWTPGVGATRHVVYLGQTSDEVAGATTGGVTVTEPAYQPEGLQSDKIYYWRVDEINSETVRGPVWKFYTVPVADGEIIDPNLFGWWKLDEGEGRVAVDYSGHGNHGTLKGNPSWDEGVFGSSLRCWDGSGLGGVALPDMPDFTPPECTLSGWIFQDQMIPGWSYFFGNRTGEPFGLMRANTNNLRLNWPGGSRGWGTDSGLELPVGEWAFVAASIQPNEATLYVNDATWTRQANFAPAVFSNTNFIGMDPTKGPNKALRGRVDDFRLYGKALSPEEMQQVMRGEPWLAWGPEPGNGSTTDVERAALLQWQAGDGATAHDVYLATDPDALHNADVGDTTGVYLGRVQKAEFSLAEVLPGMTYYWRVDEVQADGSLRKGNPWKFTTVTFLIVDDFEAYGGDAGQEVWRVWLDGYAEPSLGGSFAGHADPPYVEKQEVHGGAQSLPLYYDNDGGDFTHEGGSVTQPTHSAVQRRFDPPQDWTRHAVETLSLAFRGLGSVSSVAEDGGVYTVQGAGNDIWATRDSFAFVYESLTGDGSLTARVDSVENTHPWARAGVMIRESMEAGAVHGTVAVTPANGVNFTRRDLPDGQSFNVKLDDDNALQAPYWVRVVRTGSLVQAFASADGQQWRQIGSDAVMPLSQTVFIGLEVCSHAGDRVPCEAVFSQVTTTGQVTGGPFVTLDEVGITSNTPADLSVAIADAQGRTAVMGHPDNPRSVLRNAWEPPFEIVLADVAAQGVDLTHVASVTVSVGQPGDPADGTGLLYLDDLRLVPPAPAEPNVP